jgi:hypothetical protein
VWAILRRHGRIARRRPGPHEPLDPPPPLTSWHLDVKDVTPVPGDPEGKRGHAVEALNGVDCGPSLLVWTRVRADSTEETALAAVAEVVQEHGLPEELTIDRDPRFVGAPGARAFPSPFVRFLTCLGVTVHVTPPDRPHRTASGERSHGPENRECRRVDKPVTLEQAREVTAAFRQHSNRERPNQALTCGNRPPLVAFPASPPRPPVPAEVDPDAWLRAVADRRSPRKVTAGGLLRLDNERSFVGRRLAGQRVTLAVDAAAGDGVVRQGGAVVTCFPLRGLRGQRLPFERDVAVMSQEAVTQARRARRAAWARAAAAEDPPRARCERTVEGADVPEQDRLSRDIRAIRSRTSAGTRGRPMGRRECLDHVLPLDERHLRTILTAYVDYYNRPRPHRTLQLRPPRPQERPRAGPASPGPGTWVQSRPILGGLHHGYEYAA